MPRICFFLTNWRRIHYHLLLIAAENFLMSVDPSSTEGLIIRKLVPLASLPSKPLKALCADMVIEEIHDDFLFKKGDTDDRLVYLVSGTVILQAQGLVVDSIDANHDSAHFALAHQIPRKIDALAKGVVRFLRLNANVINNPAPLIYQEDDGYIVAEEDASDTDDWMDSLVKLPILQHLTPANLQKILISLEFVDVNKGATILKQGNHDEYYYLIKSGTCLVTHKPSVDAKEIKLAQLSKGNTLGEDALIFESPRTETITALSDVALLRLNKRQFVTLIKEPSLHFIDFLEMQQILLKGATVLDIRTPDKYKERHLNGSINIPFFSLKARLQKLSSETPNIIISDSDKPSEAAAFLLTKHRYRVYILKGGINDITVAPENEATFFSCNIDCSTYGDDSESVFDDLQLKTHNSDARIIILEAENDKLRQDVAELNQRYAQMKMDKDNAEKQTRILSKQVDKLTQVLNKFKVAKTK